MGLQVKAVYKDRIEIRAVKWAKVGLVEDTKTGEKGFRLIPIPPQTAEILKLFCQGRKPDDQVFGDLVSYETSQSLGRALEKSGIMTNKETPLEFLDGVLVSEYSGREERRVATSLKISGLAAGRLRLPVPAKN